MVSWTDLISSESLKSIKAQRYSPSSRSPEVLVWNVTSQCNLSCGHCYYNAKDKRDPEELTTAEAIDFISDLSNFGVETILFSGGEPLLRKDIFELARFAKEKRLNASLSTNGTLLTASIAKEIRASGISYVGISLDGMEGTNDAFRKKKGAFRASLSAIRNCRDAGIKVGLRFTLTRYNICDLPGMFDVVEEEAVKRFCIYHLVYVGRGEAIKKIDLSHEEKRCALNLIWEKVLEFYKKGIDAEVLTVDNHADGPWIYLKLKKVNPKRARMALELLKFQGGNGAGLKIGAVDDRGNIYADQFLRSRPVGNIRKAKFSDVWKDDDFLKSLRDRRNSIKGRCSSCGFFSICNGNFRARAEAASGDIWGDDPSCYLTDEEISKKWN